jgi:hypothetical protein
MLKGVAIGIAGTSYFTRILAPIQTVPLGEHEWDDPEFLKAFKSKGVAIRVTEGETKTAELTVIRIKNEQETRP